MRESASPSQTTSSVKPLIIYWIICAVVGRLWLRVEMTQPLVRLSAGHIASVGAGLLATIVTTVAYRKVTTRGLRSLHFPTLFGFSLINGICETAIFLASFKLGVACAAMFTAQPLWLFLAGTLTFFAYSGAIHALFWLKILPPHLNKSPAVKGARRIWILGLVVMSLVWGWVYFAYQDFWSVAALHALFDAGMVYCIRYKLG